MKARLVEREDLELAAPDLVFCASNEYNSEVEIELCKGIRLLLLIIPDYTVGSTVYWRLKGGD